MMSDLCDSSTSTSSIVTASDSNDSNDLSQSLNQQLQLQLQQSGKVAVTRIPPPILKHSSASSLNLNELMYHSQSSCIHECCLQPAQRYQENDICRERNYVYVNDVPNELQCSLCSDVYYKPVMHIVCGYTFCSDCVKQCISSQCPMCRAEFAGANLVTAPRCINDIIGNLIVMCTLCYSEMSQSHYTMYHQCQQLSSKCNSVQCPNQCGKYIIDTELQSHIDNHCQIKQLCCFGQQLGCAYIGTQLSMVPHNQQCPYSIAYKFITEIKKDMEEVQHMCAHYKSLYHRCAERCQNQANQIYNMSLQRTMDVTNIVIAVADRGDMGQLGEVLFHAAMQLVDSLHTFCDRSCNTDQINDIRLALQQLHCQVKRIRDRQNIHLSYTNDTTTNAATRHSCIII